MVVVEGQLYLALHIFFPDSNYILQIFLLFRENEPFKKNDYDIKMILM